MGQLQAGEGKVPKPITLSKQVGCRRASQIGAGGQRAGFNAVPARYSHNMGRVSMSRVAKQGLGYALSESQALALLTLDFHPVAKQKG